MLLASHKENSKTDSTDLQNLFLQGRLVVSVFLGLWERSAMLPPQDWPFVARAQDCDRAESQDSEP